MPRFQEDFLSWCFESYWSSGSFVSAVGRYVMMTSPPSTRQCPRRNKCGLPMLRDRFSKCWSFLAAYLLPAAADPVCRRMLRSGARIGHRRGHISAKRGYMGWILDIPRKIRSFPAPQLLCGPRQTCLHVYRTLAAAQEWSPGARPCGLRVRDADGFHDELQCHLTCP